jgi:hypothetical protein
VRRVQLIESDFLDQKQTFGEALEALAATCKLVKSWSVTVIAPARLQLGHASRVSPTAFI